MDNWAIRFWICFAACVGILTGYGVSRILPAWAGVAAGMGVFGMLVVTAGLCLTAGDCDRQEEREIDAIRGGLEERR